MTVPDLKSFLPRVQRPFFGLWYAMVLYKLLYYHYYYFIMN